MQNVSNYLNFSRGKLDHDLNGRFDLPIYYTGSDVFQNFTSNFKGNAIYRLGFEDMIDFEDCALYRFNFSINQNYILVFYNLKLRILTYDAGGNFGWILDGSNNILEIVTPYTLAQSKELRVSRNADVMYIAHSSHSPRKLIRTSATNFTLTSFNIKGDPFSQKTATINGVTKAFPAVVTTSAAHGFRDGDLIEITDVVGMTKLNGKVYEIGVESPTTFNLRGVDSTSYTAYSSGGTAKRYKSNPTQVLFYKGRLYYASSISKPTTVWASAVAEYDNLEIPTTVVADSPLQLTLSDISQKINWLFAGDNSLIAGSSDGIVAINGGGVNEPIKADKVEANITTAEPCNNVYPVTKDGLIFYVGVSGRNVYSFSYDLLNESFLSENINIVSHDVTESGIKKLSVKRNKDDYIYCLKNNGTFLTLNYQKQENIVGFHEHLSNGFISDFITIVNNEGESELFGLYERDSVFYIERQAKEQEFPSRTLFFTGNKEEDDKAYIRYCSEILNKCIYLDNARVFNLLKDNIITYDEVAGTITSTSPVFNINNIGRHISYMTITGYESGRFEITDYISDTEVEVKVLQEPTHSVYRYWYLSFRGVSGLTQFDGKEVGVVADGGFLDDFIVEDEAIDFGTEVTNVVIGYRYAGIIKSFSLGFQMGNVNTQATFKGINKASVRFVNSAGGKFGTSIYKLAPLQQLTQRDLNYLPTILMEGTQEEIISDDFEKDKYFYIAQDLPLPLTITAVIIEGTYGVK